MSSNYRPVYHFSPQRGWINDPNGLVYFNGLWHLFYQHMPSETHWGPMHWGHAVSRDLTHWEHWPIALYPDQMGGIFSGSAAVVSQGDEHSELVACFTHASEISQVQSVAFSHDGGLTWEKYEGNPVLTLDRPEFRDPKIFRHGNRWLMVVAAGFEAQIYASSDLLHWTLLSGFPAPKSDWVWECPDLFELDGRWVLIASFIRPGSAVDDGHGSYYWIGDFDGAHFTPETDILPLTFGPDDYAAVSWSNAPDERRVIIGWMSKWAYAATTPTADDGWRGAMTLPRDLSLRGDHLIQNPSPEVFERRGEGVTFDENRIPFEGDAYELEAEIDISKLTQTQVGFRLRVGNGEATRVFYDTIQREMFIDRSQSGHVTFHSAFSGRFHDPLEVEGDVLKLRIFVDRCSIEAFVQDGELYGPMLVFPSLNSQKTEFFGQGARITKGVIYPYKAESKMGLDQNSHGWANGNLHYNGALSH
ncbi:levanase [Abditibacteriota bacterium]|nr:levanase [Abditibacteriota bacterium]